MAVKFDGTVRLVRSATLHGATSSKKGTISFWFMIANGEGEMIFSGGPSTTHRISLASASTDGDLTLILRNSSGTALYNATTTEGDWEDSLWHHVIISIDLSVPSVTWRIDGAAPTLSETTAATDGTIDYVGCTRWLVGANYDATAIYSGSLFDFLFKAGVAIDITDTDELERFISSDGRTASGDLFWQNVGPNAGRKPVGYGVGAPVFAGEKPEVFFSNAFQQNKGTGGDFVLTSSTFDAASSEPYIYRHAAHYDNKERWFDSELTGFSYTRSRTFIELREGHPKKGLRMGIDELDAPFRQERPADTLNQLLFNDREDDTEEWDR